MNIYEAEDFVRDLYPDRKIYLDLDRECYKCVCICLDHGKPNENGYVDCSKVKFVVDGIKDIYIPIEMYRKYLRYKEILEIINNL